MCPDTGLRYDENAGDGLAGQCLTMVAGTDTDPTGSATNPSSGPTTTTESTSMGPSTTMNPTEPTSSDGTDSSGTCGNAGQACCANDQCNDPGLACTSGGVCSCVSDIVSGSRHNCLLKVDGSVWCWGANDLGQLGTSANNFESTPIQVMASLGPGVDAMSALITTCVHRADNIAVCWGDNASGQVDPADLVSMTLGPTQNAVATSATRVANGRSHTCFGRSGANVATCFGDNTTSQLTGTDPGPGPVNVSGSTEFEQLQGGLNHTCGRGSNGAIQCWGNNAQGQLGADPMTVATSPTLFSVPLSPAGDVAVGRNFTCARVNTTIHCWGQNNLGQLGDGTGVNNFNPLTEAMVPGTVSVTDLIAADDHACVIADAGDLYCWGSNQNGQLRLPPDKMGADQTFTLVPVEIDIGDINAVDFAGGTTHSCVLGDDGRIFCWGTNSSGQIGDGTTAFAFDPTQVQVTCP
jgi:alpha-tubulin suppressor-like RCC1 family protein